jgi:hypothetical protein
MINRLKIGLERAQDSLKIQSASEFFIRAMYIVLLWSTAKLSLIGDVVWGEYFIHQLYDPYTNFDRFAMLLNNELVRPYWWLFAAPMLVLLLAGILGWHNFISRAVVAYLFVVLHYGNVEISTGGHHLTQQLLFFHVLLFRVPEQNWSKLASLQRFLHHLAFYSIWVQIALMYLIAGVWKWTGTTWLSGDAMLLTLSYKEFGFPWLADVVKERNVWLWIGNHVAFAYQMLFIALIWIRPIRFYFLSLGLLFHLGIAFLIGITDFGLLMIAMYAIFINPTTAKKYLYFIGKLKISRAYLP